MNLFRYRTDPVFRVLWLFLAGVILVGCGQQNDRGTAMEQSEKTSTVTDDLHAVVEEQAIESVEVADELATAVRGGLHPNASSAAPIREMVNEPMALESATASIRPPKLNFPEIASAEIEPKAMAAPPPPKASQSFEHLPSGSVHNAEEKFARVKVFYATDRAPGAVPLSAYQITGEKELLQTLLGVSAFLLFVSVISWIRRRKRFSSVTTSLGIAAMAASVALFLMGQTSFEKHGVTYTGDRGILTRGVCEVTVPVVHQKGIVERPSLLRFEFREDQDKHIVLTSAVELQHDTFYKQLSGNVGNSPDRDLLVFIHGYNVDFESAVQRTAQISVDLPFEGVPICYSWPSQGKLLSYSIDENNAQWSVTHLREFLQELAQKSGADSINVVAHSMGNRAMTGAMQQIVMQAAGPIEPMFDRVVLAAPDVDADQFRRDLAPSLLQVANQVTLYASSDDRALIASKKVHGYPRAGESGADLVVVPGIETIDVSGIDLSLLGHSYYGDNESMLRDLYEVVRSRLPAQRRRWLIPRQAGLLPYWQLARKPVEATTH